MVQRLHPHPYLSLFNGPDTSVTTAMRDGSTVPLQALYLLNNPFVHDQTRRFASRLIADEPDPPARLQIGLPAGIRARTDGGRVGQASEFLAQYRAEPGRRGRTRGPCSRASPGRP